MTSPIDLDAIEARLKAATPGPWLYKGKNSEFYTQGTPPYTYGDFITQLSDHGAETITDENIELIEHAPSDIAALLAEVRRLRDVIEYNMRPVVIVRRPCGQAATDCRGCFQPGCPLPMKVQP